MSSIGFDGKLEPAFFQHILIGRVEHPPFQCGMDELEPMYAYVYMYVLHVLLHVGLMFHPSNQDVLEECRFKLPIKTYR